MRTFVISLPRCTDRRNRIEKCFKKAKLDFEWWDGFDGAVEPHSEFKKYVDFETAKKTWKGFRYGGVGCDISHVKLLQKIVDEKIPQAIIFEDDAIFEPDLFDVIKKSDNFLPPDWGVCLLGYGNHPHKLFQITKPIDGTNYSYGKMYKMVSGTYGYMVTLKGAKKLLKKLNPLVRDIDDITSDAIYANTKLYAIYPPVVSHYDIEDSVSKEINGRLGDCNEKAFNGHYITLPIRFLAIELGWSEKFAIFVDKTIRLILLFPIWKKWYKKIRDRK